MVVLEISGDGVILRIRPRLLGKMTGIVDLRAGSSADVVVEPVRSNWVWKGLKFTIPGRPPYYFWTNQREAVVSDLLTAGFQVSAQEGKMQ